MPKHQERDRHRSRSRDPYGPHESLESIGSHGGHAPRTMPHGLLSNDRHEHGRRPSLIGEDINYVLTNTTSPQRLSEAAQRLVSRVKFRDIEGFVKYVNANLDLFREDNLHVKYLGEAIDAMVMRKPSWARNCVEKFLLVKECSQLSTAGRTQFLQKLYNEDESTIEDFDTKYDRTMQYCRNEAEQRQENSSDKRRERPPTVPGQKAVDNDRHKSEPVIGKGKARELYPPIAPPPDRHNPNVEFEDYDNEVAELQQTMSRLPTDLQSRHAVESSVRSRDEEGSHWTETELRKAPSYRGNKGQRARLDDHLTIDPAYKKLDPRAAGAFFVEGKVFAIVDHQEDNRATRSQSHDMWTTETKSGLFILSHVRRFIVVKEGHGWCWAVGISTYGGQGVSKKGFNKADRDAHAIAYTAGRRPTPLPKEAKLLKDPIAINPVSRNGKVETLDGASRIDFARVRTVEHNVRVKLIGEVARESLPYLRSYWTKHRDE